VNKIKILLAEDHTVVREGLRELIEREQDLEVVAEAGDGEEALELVSRTDPDVAIIDIAMPRLNGIELTGQIKALYPSVAVIILTAYDNEEFVFALLEAGAAGYLLKDVRGQELINAIHAVQDGDPVLHPAITRKVLDGLPSREKPSKEEKLVSLTQRELELLKLGAEGLVNKEIATRLDLSLRTVQAHWTNIFNKLGVSSRTEAVVQSLKKGYISLESLKEPSEAD
jgi:NarL family two-component system response regulator LiaR